LTLAGFAEWQFAQQIVSAHIPVRKPIRWPTSLKVLIFGAKNVDPCSTSA
jgi:hypothetical protein